MEDRGWRVVKDRLRVVVVCGLVVVAVMAAAGCNALPTSVVPTAAPPVVSVPEPPAFHLVVGGSQVEGFQGSYCWTDPAADGPGICLDRFPPIFESDSFTALDSGEVTLQFESPVPDRLTLGLSEDLFGDQVARTEIAPNATATWTPDVPAGDYILSAFGRWDVYGDAVYFFPVTLR